MAYGGRTIHMLLAISPQPWSGHLSHYRIDHRRDFGRASSPWRPKRESGSTINPPPPS